MSTAKASPLFLQWHVAALLFRSVFETFQESLDAVSVDFSLEHDAYLIRVKGANRGLLIDDDSRTWSLDDIFERYSLDDIVFSIWAKGMGLRSN